MIPQWSPKPADPAADQLPDSAALGLRQGKGLLTPFLSVIAICCMVGIAQAKPARCFTTDDGEFRCQFLATDRNGSFMISAPGKPSYRLNTAEPGVAYGFMSLGSKTISLPGRYLRDKNEPACWVNDSTQTKICAW